MSSGIGWTEVEYALLAACTFRAMLSSREVFTALFGNSRAKRALEDAILEQVKTHTAARQALLSVADGANSGNIDVKLKSLLEQSLASMRSDQAGTVKKILLRGQSEGNTAYVSDVVRHVSAKLSADASTEA